MSNIAFIDKERTRRITAEEATKCNVGTRYYCLNNRCDAHLFVCSVNGMNKAHFRASLKEHKHIDKCPYASQQLRDFDINEYEENLFDFNRIIEAMFQNENQVNVYCQNQNRNNEINDEREKVKKINTILQLYAMCKSKNIRDKYGEFEIFKMLVDERSLFFYTKGIYGYKVIECNVKKYFYNSEKKEIYLFIDNYNLVLEFEDKALFENVKGSLYSNRDRLIIVAGNWQKQNCKNNTFYTKIITKKQMHILK